MVIFEFFLKQKPSFAIYFSVLSGSTVVLRHNTSFNDAPICLI
jgi:hypothetical protein